MIRLIVWSFTIITVLTAIGCSESDFPPMDEQTYMQVRKELELLHALHSYTADTLMTASILDSLRAFYSFSDEDFLISYRYYERQIDNEIIRFESMANELDQEHIRLHDFMTEQRRLADEANRLDSSEEQQ